MQLALLGSICCLLTIPTFDFAAAKQDEKQKSSYETVRTLEGKASYYYGRWIGRKTANGEIYERNDITAAHKSLPFNTKVRVTNLENDKSIVVRINNRGPYVRGRILDLSLKAAKAIDMTGAGVVRVKAEVLKETKVVDIEPDESSNLLVLISDFFERQLLAFEENQKTEEG